MQLQPDGQSDASWQRFEQYVWPRQIRLWQCVGNEHAPPRSVNETCAHDVLVDGVVFALSPWRQMLNVPFGTHSQFFGHWFAVVHRFVHTNDGFNPQHCPDWHWAACVHPLPRSVNDVLSPHPFPEPASAGGGALQSFGPAFVPPSQPPPACPVQQVPKLLQDFGQATAASSHRPLVQWRVLTGGPCSHSQYQLGQSSSSLQVGALLDGAAGAPGVFVPGVVPGMAPGSFPLDGPVVVLPEDEAPVPDPSAPSDPLEQPAAMKRGVVTAKLAVAKSVLAERRGDVTVMAARNAIVVPFGRPLTFRGLSRTPIASCATGSARLAQATPRNAASRFEPDDTRAALEGGAATRGASSPECIPNVGWRQRSGSTGTLVSFRSAMPPGYA